VNPRENPSELTTVAFRCFGGRAFGTTIGPGGVPEKTETLFPPGSAFRGFSFSLDGMAALSMPLRIGHARRLVVIELDALDLKPRVRDALLLAVSKERLETASGHEWATAFEFRFAEAPSRAETSLVTGRGGEVRRATRAGRLDALAVQLSGFAP